MFLNQLRNLPLRNVVTTVSVGAFVVFLFAALAVALPLFTMNVYDRVVPNRAVETLWMLAIGVLIVLFGDFTLRSMRAYFLDLAGTGIAGLDLTFALPPMSTVASLSAVTLSFSFPARCLFFVFEESRLTGSPARCWPNGIPGIDR